MKTTFDEAYEIGKQSTTSCKQITHGINGYPLFHGRTEFAFFGFDTFEEAETLAEEIGGTVQHIHYRDGWQLCESKGNAYEPFTNSSEDYGDDYCEWGDPSTEFQFITENLAYDYQVTMPGIVETESGDPDYHATIEKIRELFEPLYESGELSTVGKKVNPFPQHGTRFERYQPSDKEAIESMLNNFEENYKEYMEKPAGSEVITCCGSYFETIQTKSMAFCYDTHNNYIAVVINSDDYDEEDEDEN